MIFENNGRSIAKESSERGSYQVDRNTFFLSIANEWPSIADKTSEMSGVECSRSEVLDD